MDHVLALDQGTTSSRAIVFDHDGRPVATAQHEFRQIFPQPGLGGARPRGDLDDPDRDRGRSPRAGLAAAAATWRRSASPTSARPRSCGTARPAGPWPTPSSGRTGAPPPFCDRLRAEGVEDMVRERTGLVLDAYFSATKIALDPRQRAGRARPRRGRASSPSAPWTPGSLHRLTSGRLHVTDPSNASRTLLFNIRTGDWDDELLRVFGVPRSMLPEVRASSEVYGEVSTSLGLAGPAIAGIAGDQQAALFGQRCTARRHGEEHLRHRLLPAAEHGRRRRSPRATGS